MEKEKVTEPVSNKYIDAIKKCELQASELIRKHNEDEIEKEKVSKEISGIIKDYIAHILDSGEAHVYVGPTSPVGIYDLEIKYQICISDIKIKWHDLITFSNNSYIYNIKPAPFFQAVVDAAKLYEQETNNFYLYSIQDTDLNELSVTLEFKSARLDKDHLNKYLGIV